MIRGRHPPRADEAGHIEGAAPSRKVERDEQEIDPHGLEHRQGVIGGTRLENLEVEGP